MGRKAASPRRATPAAAGLTFDAGALISLDRGEPRVRALVRTALTADRPVHVPAGALAQAWRAQPRQHALWLLVSDPGVSVVALGMEHALAIGSLLAATTTSDVIDASIVITARSHDDVVVTSDTDDIRRLDPDLATIPV